MRDHRGINRKGGSSRGKNAAQEVGGAQRDQGEGGKTNPNEKVAKGTDGRGHRGNKRKQHVVRKTWVLECRHL